MILIFCSRKMCQYTNSNEAGRDASGTAQENNGANNTNWHQQAQRQEQLYPNLDQFWDNILPQNQTEFLRDFLAGGTPPTVPPSGGWGQTPTAPPAPPSGGGWGQFLRDVFTNGAPPAPPSGGLGQTPTAPPVPPSGGWHQPQQPQQQQHEQHRRQFDDEIGPLMKRMCLKFINHFSKAAGFFALFLILILIPRSFLIIGIVSAFLKSFDIPIIPVILGGLLFQILTALGPGFVPILAIWALYKTCNLRRPLFDANYWRGRIYHRCQQ
jgi:hypothetical protein